MSNDWKPPTAAMNARVAFMRFGLGPKPGGAARIGNTTTSALNACLRELNITSAVTLTDPRLPNYATACANEIILGGAFDKRLEEVEARVAKHLEPEVGFVERLVLFWSNHFSLFHGKEQIIRVTAGQMERDVIRRHVLGKFPDMLVAVMRHPAMLYYLDNTRSIGPNSAWTQADKDINENLAREILELHTVGVEAGYTRQDIRELSRILTGWTKRPARDPQLGRPGQYLFNPSMHEPGTFTVMGKSYSQPGEAKGIAALRDLALHPKTAEHLARKLVLHFVSEAGLDDPAVNRMVTRLANVFTATGGDLRAMARALIQMPEAWSMPMNRLRQPYLWTVSVLRALGLDKAVFESAADMARLDSYFMAMNNHPWGRVQPDGYSDKNFVWETPNAIRIRKQIAYLLVTDFIKGDWTGPDAAVLAGNLLPNAMSPEAISAVSRVSQDKAALAMLFLTPEFLRR
jgi:uncharacterized protein (DUF1800 family)